MPEDLIVCCMNFGTKYHDDYVRRLRNAVAKNLKLKHEFFCLSDHIVDGVDTIALPERILPSSKFEGWWVKPWLFSRDAFQGVEPLRRSFPAGARVLYLDLDVVITGDLEILVKQWAADPLTMIFNFGPNRPHCAHNSSVMLWTAGDLRLFPIWELYEADADRIMKTLHGDQCWIWRVLRNDIANFPRDYISSYKYDCRPNKKPDPQARVVVFHGDPKPHQCREDWIRDHWLTA